MSQLVTVAKALTTVGWGGSVCELFWSGKQPCTVDELVVSEFAAPPPSVGHVMSGAGFNSQQVDGNLAKWFNTDVFKQQLPNMPRLPTHSTKVLTLDEIERQQQVVPN